MLSIHVIACSTDTRMNGISVSLPLFLWVSATLTLVAVSLCKHVCMCALCTCDLGVSSCILVLVICGRLYYFQEPSEPISK